MITDVDNVQTSKLKGYNANHKVQYSKFKGKRVQCSKVQREKSSKDITLIIKFKVQTSKFKV